MNFETFTFSNQLYQSTKITIEFDNKPPMFKANSLHHFNPASSLGSTPYLPLTQSLKNAYTLVYDQDKNPQRKYELPLTDFLKQSSMIDWRKKIHHPIPRIMHISQSLDSSHKQLVSIVCEHITVSFIDLRPLRVQESMYCLSEMLLGYQEIYARLGFVAVESKLIGLNHKGEILLWVSQNLLAHSTQYPRLVTEKQIVAKIVAILESKAQDKGHLFFSELRKLQPKFKTLLDFIMAFKNKHKLKIIPKIIVQSPKFATQKMMVSNTFSGKSDNHLQPNSLNNDNGVMSMKASAQIGVSQSESQFMGNSKRTVNQCSVIRNNNHTRNRTSIIMQSNVSNTPINNSLANSMHDKSAPKVNFSYSQKRQDISTPKQSGIMRDYTSDKNMPLLNKLHSETNPIKQFTLEDKKTVNVKQGKVGKRLRNNANKRIVRIYNATYTPVNGNLHLQTQLDLKRSTTSYISQSSYTSKDKLFGDNFCQNKTSMTTNHRSAVTQSFQSLGKSSNDDEYYNRKNDLFTSNHSNRTTYSIIKSSFVENQQGKNAVSFVIGNSSHDRHPHSPLNHHTFLNNTSNLQLQNNERRKEMYTFGGLLTPLLDQNHDLKQSTTIPQLVTPVISQTEIHHQKPTLVNQISTKSIDELYNNLYFNSQKKSLIMDECQYNIKLSPVKQEVYSHANQSFTIQLSQIKGHQPLSLTKKPPSQRSQKDFFTPKIEQMNKNTFDYNQWRGIKGLLNQSNVCELKQSIHCGPDIRSPMNNIKLQLLDKFGREIGQSILPSTPSQGYVSRAHSVYTITDEHSVEYY